MAEAKVVEAKVSDAKSLVVEGLGISADEFSEMKLESADNQFMADIQQVVSDMTKYAQSGKEKLDMMPLGGTMERSYWFADEANIAMYVAVLQGSTNKGWKIDEKFLEGNGNIAVSLAMTERTQQQGQEMARKLTWNKTGDVGATGSGDPNPYVVFLGGLPTASHDYATKLKVKVGDEQKELEIVLKKNQIINPELFFMTPADVVKENRDSQAAKARKKKEEVQDEANAKIMALNERFAR